MTVSARTANLAPAAARPVRPDGSPVRAGTYPYLAEDVTSGWHVHDLHQVEYAIEGVVRVETAAARYLLPPQQALWIPAGLAHNTTLKKVHSISAFFEPRMIVGKAGRARVLTVEPLFREMIRYAARWPIDRPAGDPLADSYFETLAGLLDRWLENESPYQLPTSADPLVGAAMRFTEQHLDRVTFGEVCAAVAVSERTLRRRFASQTNLTWRAYLLRSRLLRAMALLAEADCTVLGVATKVGFESASAFARAFVAYTGQTPSVYRLLSTHS